MDEIDLGDIEIMREQLMGISQDPSCLARDRIEAIKTLCDLVWLKSEIVKRILKTTGE